MVCGMAEQFTIKQVAEYIIYFASEEGNCVSNLGLQKILYFLHYLFLTENNQKLTEDTYFEAWKYGPVNPQIYYDYSIHGGFSIFPFKEPEDYQKIDQYIGESLKGKLKKLLRFTAWELVVISHTKGDAWDLVYKDGNGSRDRMNDDLIKENISKSTREKLEIE